MKSRIAVILMVICIALLSACAAAPSGSATTEGEFLTDGDATSRSNSAVPETAPAPPMEEPAVAGGESGGDFFDDGVVNQPTDGSGVDTGTTDTEAQQQQGVDRQIIYTSNLTLEVDNPRDTANALTGLARKYGGFVSNANVYEYGEDGEGNPIFRADIQLRIEAGRFDAAQDELRGLANEVVSEQIDTQDVTAEYVDTQSRIANLQRLEAELQVLLTEARERSDDMEQVLAVYRELSSVRGEIEVLQGQLNVLSDLIGLATINVTLIAPDDAANIAIVDEEWNPAVTFRESLRTLTENMQGFVDGTIRFTITTLPQLLVLALVLFVLYRIGRWIWRRVSPALNSSTPSGPSITPPPPSGD